MRNNPKPTEKVDWINDDDPTKIIAPSIAQKLSGWVKDQLPPAERFNWWLNLFSNSQIYHNAQVEDWIVIDSDADEGDYATLAAYIADSPAAGDKILVKQDQIITVQMILPASITIKLLDGVRILTSTNLAPSAIRFGTNIIIEGVFEVVFQHAGTIAIGMEFAGNNVTGQINVRNVSTGDITIGYNVNGSRFGNTIRGYLENIGGGSVPDIGADNSTEDSNILEIVDGPNNQIWRSRGAYKFREGLEYDLGSDADGDIYYRDAGILKRLAKGFDENILIQKSGIPSWETPDGSYTPSSASTTNIASVGTLTAMFTRIGNLVTVFFRLNVTPTAGAGTETNLTISIPVAVDFTSTVEVYGSGTVLREAGLSPFYESVHVEADVSNDGADIHFQAQSTEEHLIQGSFSYIVP